ncbi:MAG: NYN domain-containing protein [Nanoarchaeota archaeon]|nr:NYN domain-containing protein [Nanoarchaeota archaeon]
MDRTIVFIDDGFLSKLSKHFGEGEYLKFHRKKFAEKISEKINLKCEKIFLYTAAPFQSSSPNKKEIKRKEGYDKFKHSLVKEGIEFREGRCQRLKIDSKFEYKQKAVDILLARDLMNIHFSFPEINKIILVSSDTDFVPIIDDLVKKGIEVILLTYFDKKRGSPFSLSNHLFKACSRYIKLTKKDFEEVCDE